MIFLFKNIRSHIEVKTYNNFFAFSLLLSNTQGVFLSGGRKQLEEGANPLLMLPYVDRYM
jgi:hypothetical protein